MGKSVSPIDLSVILIAMITIDKFLEDNVHDFLEKHFWWHFGR